MNRYLPIMITLLLICLCGLTEVSAQGYVPQVNAEQAVSMADTMRSNGKIYVVLAVVLLIQSGLFLLLWRLDRKLARLENLK